MSYRALPPIYGHGMHTTPSVDGWQHGYRDLNGYRAEIAIYGDGLARGWNDYSVTIWDYETGRKWWFSGNAQYPDMRARALAAMRNRANGGPRAFGYVEMS